VSQEAGGMECPRGAVWQMLLRQVQGELESMAMFVDRKSDAIQYDLLTSMRVMLYRAIKFSIR
jgi:hypothetical protein